jgi:hypothetical protein
LKKIFALTLWCVLSARGIALADSSIVFNEIMYHPATNSATMQWVELYNQMACDVDMSSWSLDGDIHYQFPANTVVHGGAFIVVAISPSTLMAATTGLTNVFGPFSSQLPNGAGQILVRNNNGVLVNEIDYDNNVPWPVAPNGGGVSLAKIDHSTGSGLATNWTWSAQMGGTPGRENFPSNAVPINLAFNEFSASTDPAFWLELANYGTNSISLAGYVISYKGVTNAEYIFPSGNLAAHGFLVLSNNILGFHPSSNENVFLMPPTRTNVIDAAIIRPGARCRFPDGVGPWCTPTTLTQGASNNVVFHTEIVINEIMYHHQVLPSTNGLPPPTSSEQWAELYNRSGSTVNLTGWHLEGGINYDFAAGKVINPGAYLVVAKDSAALRATYPAIDIVGDFSGKLSHNGDSVILDDASDNRVCSVNYYSGGRWPEIADGGGSSLELRDPLADPSKGETWAASDETGKSSWQTNTYTATAVGIVGPVQWNDLLMGMLSEGECLIDDISVIDSPSGSPVQMISNGNFESGATGWRFLGNHAQSKVEPEVGNPANHVLHVVAQGLQEDSHNHIEATYANGRVATNGHTFQISYRAKWLAGNNMFNTRLYFDRLSKSMPMTTPQHNGTPGARNSRYATNIGPTFVQFQHKPVVPAANQAVTVTTIAQDPQGVSGCEVWWSAGGAAFSHATMNPTNGVYGGTIPGFSAGTVVQFYVKATDGLGAIATFPAANSNAGALYTVADGQANLSLGHNFRIIMTPANWGLMRDPTNLMSDAFLPCTLIYDEQRPYYNILARLKGSMAGRVYDLLPGFHLEFQPDDLFRGEHPSILVNTSGRGSDSSNKQEDILVHHIALHAGGLPDVHRDIGRMIAPGGNVGPSVICPRYEDLFIDAAYNNGGNGNEFILEITYYSTTTNSAGYKLPAPASLTGPDISDLGSDKETYRYNYIIKNHRTEDDYSRLIPFAKTLSLPSGPVLDAQTKQVMDMDEWLRAFAFVSLLGESDWYSFGFPHNLLMYVRPDDNKLIAFLWDIEHITGQPASNPLIGGYNFSKVEKLPGNTRRLYGHALDIMASTYNTSYLTYWANHYQSFAPGQNYSDLLNYIPQRTAAVLSEINLAGGNAAFALTVPTLINATSNLVALSGTAGVGIQNLMVNGIQYPITWLSVSNWTIMVPLTAISNRFSFAAYDLKGNLLSNSISPVTVMYGGPLLDPPGKVVINEIMYNPSVSNASYIELRNTSATTSYDLSGWRVNGIGYTFPSGSIITNGQYLVLASDQSAFINAYGTGIVPYDIYTGSLQADGETLTLYMPGPATNQETVVDKVHYSASPPWPAPVPGSSLQLIDPAQDNSRVADWAAAPGTPGALNSVNATISPGIPPLWINELQADNLTGITNHGGQRTAWIEVFNSGSNAVSLNGFYLAKAYTNLTTWAFPTGVVVNPGQFKVVFVDSQTGLSTTNEPHTSFTMTSGGGSLALSRLYNSVPQVLDFVDYTNLTPNHSYGSFPDGQSFDRQEFAYATPGATNNGSSAPLTVSINEWMAGNTHTLVDPVGGKYSDWFELYNYGTNTASLNGYYLTDTLTNQLKYAIPAGYTIPAHSFLLVWADSKNTNGTPDIHASFKLAKSGGSIGLYGSDGNPVDYVNYAAQSDDISEGRYPDASINRFLMTTATPRTNNVIPNTAPVLASITNRYVYPGQMVQFTAMAADAESPPQVLTYTLDAGAPAGSSIGSASGVFTWVATNTPMLATNVITVRVTDNGTPPLNSTRTFSVFVSAPLQFGTSSASGGFLHLAFNTLPGQNYQVQYKDNLDDPTWTALGAIINGNGSPVQVDDPLSGHANRFYLLAVVP